MHNNKIFILFDTVHLFKSIRNIWLNQKNTDFTFIYPHIDTHQLILRANISDLVKLYESELSSIDYNRQQ